MGIKFSSAAGGAKRKSISQYVMKEGDNRLRMFGDLLPRMLYWVPNGEGGNMPMECLSFNREKETFLNEEKDWVREYYPDLKCGWAYSIQCLDYSDGTAKVWNMKKKLTDQIKVAAEDLGDPTDETVGWDVHFKRVKTGSKKWNVEYQLQTLKCQKSIRALDDNEMALVKEAAVIDELFPRPTPDAQKELLERFMSAGAGADSNTDDDSVDNEFDVS